MRSVRPGVRFRAEEGGFAAVAEGSARCPGRTRTRGPTFLGQVQRTPRALQPCVPVSRSARRFGCLGYWDFVCLGLWVQSQSEPIDWVFRGDQPGRAAERPVPSPTLPYPALLCSIRPCRFCSTVERLGLDGARHTLGVWVFMAQWERSTSGLRRTTAVRFARCSRRAPVV